MCDSQTHSLTHWVRNGSKYLRCFRSEKFFSHFLLNAFWCVRSVLTNKEQIKRTGITRASRLAGLNQPASLVKIFYNKYYISSDNLMLINLDSLPLTVSLRFITKQESLWKYRNQYNIGNTFGVKWSTHSFKIIYFISHFLHLQLSFYWKWFFERNCIIKGVIYM